MLNYCLRFQFLSLQITTVFAYAYKDKQFKAHVRTEIANRQATVLSGLLAGEFALSHRYKNFECFAGQVSSQGFDKLLKHPLVESVELSRLEHKMLAQGIGLINASTSRVTYNGQNVAVAISDTGVDYNHPRLGGGGFPNGKVIGGYCNLFCLSNYGKHL